MFKATEEQILKLGANAVNAASPMGMGFLHFQEKEYTAEDIGPCLSEWGLDIDYFEGRMTKLHIRREKDGWDEPGEPRSDYQSWCSKYPTFKDLAQSVGVTIQ